jgi:hypothetical protein
MLYGNQIYAELHALFLQIGIKAISGQSFLTDSGLKKLKDSKLPQKERNPVSLKLAWHKRKS